MQEIKIHTWCDPHPDDEKTPAVSWTVTLQPPELAAPLSFHIDLCPTCRKPYDDLLAGLVEHGQPATPPKRKRAPGAPPSTGLPTKCQAPDCEYVPPSMSAYKTHTSSKHDLTPAELSGEATLACPAPECGRKFTHTQGQFTHVRTQHPDRPELMEELRGQQAA